MSKQNSAEQFEKAGAEAAEVLAKFLNVAASFGREFNQNTSEAGPSNSDTRHGQSPVYDSRDALRDVGVRLREMRSAAGYTMDGFARALQDELKHEDELRQDGVAEKIDAVEAGRDALPKEWSNAISALLKNRDVSQLFEQFTGTDDGRSDHSDKAHPVTVQATRAARLSELFDHDPALAELTEDDFEKLLLLVQGSYDQAKAVLLK